jgi:hypothetical protein
MKKTTVSVIGLLLCLIAWRTSSASDRSDPCALLTREEAASLAGEPVEIPEAQDSRNPLGQKMCLYHTESSTRLIQLSLIRNAEIQEKIRRQGQTAKKIYKTTTELLDPAERVSGIGDDACWGTPGLHILKGDVYLLVSVGNTSKRENLELARQIAMKVLPRL